MKKLAVITVSILSVLTTWLVLLPFGFMYSEFPPEETIRSFERFGMGLPTGCKFLLTILTMNQVYAAAAVISVVLVLLGGKAMKRPGYAVTQVGVLATWCSVVAVIFLLFILPLFKMGEVVCGGGYGVGKSDFTGIRFICDSLPEIPEQLFMQRKGDKEVAIPQDGSERWSNLDAASGTNRAFVLTYTRPRQSYGAVSESEARWWRWPARLVEITLPMPDQPLTNYSLQTLWSCKSKEDVKDGDLIPYSIRSSWDGNYLTVRSHIYDTGTDDSESDTAMRIYDVRDARFLSGVPGAK